MTRPLPPDAPRKRRGRPPGSRNKVQGVRADIRIPINLTPDEAAHLDANRGAMPAATAIKHAARRLFRAGRR